ncbi:MAG TPA: helix-turn-helix transcriptional regulator [Blastocatellia bacterium]|nr:helix-turn-helix transcriptional regulator [Blastocatellia bacterium]HMX27641.1 helix-turn-helix transcriptional regulator [Blastocatellia bacterium]HMZ17127.1 helix-turn-helix transcriptional regulator [Blastocatellia bacterium]HNG32623.1 helix-turn-helix transcriptional regulator [Blastocatellia bacterium]
MIRNARQYRITKAQAEKFRRSLNEFDDSPARHVGIHPKLIKAQREAIASQLESLEQEIQEYEQLQKDRHTLIDIDLVAELPKTLIRARIAAGLSQRELAARLGLKEQQIQRYEATNYESASLKRVLEVARVLTA